MASTDLPSGIAAAPPRAGVPPQIDPPPERTLPARSTAEKLLVLGVPIALLAAVAGLLLTGTLDEGRLLSDPGNLVLWGLPLARVLHDASASVTIGLLILATFILPGQKRIPGRVSRVQAAAVRWAGRAAACWFLSAWAVLAFTAANTFGTPLTAPSFPGNLVMYMTQIDLGRAMSLSLACVTVVLIMVSLARRLSWVACANFLAVFALLPLSLAGHAAGTDEHGNAVNSLALHLIGVTAWVGGLVAVILLRRQSGRAFPTVVGRYSTLAGWAFAAVAFSGIVNSSLRLGGPAELLTTGYGQLLSVKILILILLGVLGARYRLRIIPRLRENPRSRGVFLRFAVAEVLFMAVAMGLSVALSRSSPPVPQNPIPLAGEVDALARRALLGFPFPEPATGWTMLTSFHADWLWIAAAVVGAGLYLRTVLRLRRRGDSWPLSRTICWVAGCLMLIYVTSGGPGVYAEVSFSTHMMQHMGLMMFVPPLLVLGGPVLLALRALPVRTDGGRGLREWILVLVHSRYLRFLSRPAVAGIIFAGSLIVFYYTGWFQWAMFTHEGHFLMTVHFLASGYLFFWVLIGVDPGPTRPLFPMRLVLLLSTLAFHAFFGLALMSGTEILGLDWWTAMRYTDHAALLADQRVGGGVAWGTGEFPTVLVAMVVVAQWMRSEERAAKRYDRAADRDGDAELRAYNAALGEIGERDERAGFPAPATTAAPPESAPPSETPTDR